MAERESNPNINIDVSRSLELVTAASQAQAEKLKYVLDRIDIIAKLDKDALNSVTGIISAAKADGGCGIGCW